MCSGSHIATTADGDAGEYINTSNASSDEWDLSADADETVTVTPPDAPGLEIVKDAVDIDGVAYVDGDTATVGQTINYDVTVTNTGNVALSDVVVTDPGLDAPGLTCAWPNGDGVLAVGDGSAATLDDGDTVICTGSYVATTADADAGEYVNVSTATSNEWELSTDGTETVNVTVEPPPLEITNIDLASIGDTVFSDDNSNGVQDPGEEGIANAPVRLTLPDGTFLDLLTDANGVYLFIDLAAGEYTVELVLASIAKPENGDYTATTATSFTIQLAENQAFDGADFGVVVTPATTQETLPNTGIDSDQMLAIALALLILGGAAVLATTRKKQDDDGSLAA